jgi:lipoyl(octanoyl) transferase
MGDSKKINKLTFRDLGLNKYQQTWDLQEELFNEIIQTKVENRKSEPQDQKETQSHFIFVEHPHVYTLGKSGDASNLLINQQTLEQKGAEFIKVNRGGDITYHGPGQIVGYPILDLDNFFTDIHLYLRKLEQVIIDTIAEYGLKGDRSEGETGVWLDVGKPTARKICALGVRTSRWVTMHGFALNVNSDLQYFDYIIPCGIRGKNVASMHAELGRKLDMDEVKQKILNNFKKEFSVEFDI